MIIYKKIKRVLSTEGCVEGVGVGNNSDEFLVDEVINIVLEKVAVFLTALVLDSVVG